MSDAKVSLFPTCHVSLEGQGGCWGGGRVGSMLPDSTIRILGLMLVWTVWMWCDREQGETKEREVVVGSEVWLR